jgi:ferredoxin-fold anticodon binding domain-containing protein
MSALEENRSNGVSMNSLFENWRGYISESLDPGILEGIVENIESIIEIPVRKVYKSSLINESEGVSVKVQLAGFYTDKLMNMISERWLNSKERSVLQEKGYNIEIIPDGNSLDENYILLTRELL